MKCVYWTAIVILLQGVTVATQRHGSGCQCPTGYSLCPLSQSQADCTCISRDWFCDGINDCLDGSDEFNCDDACRGDQFKCSNLRCVNSLWVCDGEDDCGDASDEILCSNQNCTEEEFACDGSRCISQDWLCDGEEDCADGSDEACNKHTAAQLQVENVCSENEFYCGLADKCIPQAFRCDGVRDCDSGQDEVNCSVTAEISDCYLGEFTCENGVCINSSWLCDGDFDCDDHSDEVDCELRPPSNECSGGDWFRCKSGQCVHQAYRCDMHADCTDGSDELDCPSDTTHEGCEHNNGGCSHTCVDDASGVSHCSCPPGHQLDSRGLTCHDTDECQSAITCSQLCTNVPGSFYCSCTLGFTLKSDGRGCKADDVGGKGLSLLLANQNQIVRITPDVSDANEASEVTELVDGLKNAVALDVHLEQELLFWSDITLNTINVAYLNGTNSHVLISTDISSPGGLAVDWVHNLLFWTDGVLARIEVADLHASTRRVVVWQDLDKPRAIVVHPALGAIYWTEWGSRPRISRVAMDGSDRVTVVHNNILWPNCLTIDYAADRLYWIDARYHVLETARLDGSQRQTLVDHGLLHPFALAVHEDMVYWSDWSSRSVMAVDRLNSQQGPSELLSNIQYPMDLIAVHTTRQPHLRNHCSSVQHGCSHLCLPNLLSYTCACPTGYRLLTDRQTCSQDMDSFLLVARRTDIRRVSFDSEEGVDVTVPLMGLHGAVGIDFDERDGYVYWSDITTDTISRAHLNGSRQQVIIKDRLMSPVGLSIDWLTRKLYWTDAGTLSIEVALLDGSYRTLLVYDNLQRPRDIAVEPLSGWMYWTDWGDNARIERAGMDGSQRQVIVSSNLRWPNGLVVDAYSGSIYFADAGTHLIEVCDTDGQNRRVLISEGVKHPFSLTIGRNVLYWTDWQTKAIHYTSLQTIDDQHPLLDQRELAMGVKFVLKRGHTVKASTACDVDNGGCSHLCLLSPVAGVITCACPLGITLSDDGHTCQPHMNNMLVFAQRTSVQLLSLDVDYYASVTLPVQGVQNAIASNFDVLQGKVYWFDSTTDKIQRANIDGSEVEDVVTADIDTVEGLAVDPIGRKLYFIDSVYKQLEVTSLDGFMRKILVWKNLDSPRSIALCPEKGLMFWTDWGMEAKIERAAMDGSRRTVIVRSNIGWPNGLAIDKQLSRIVWADAKTETIESADFSGQARRVLIRSVPHPYGVAVSGQFIYWTDWQTRAILRAHHVTGAGVTTIIHNVTGLMDVHAVDRTTAFIAYVDRCGENNGGCSHLCLPTPGGYVCACPTGLSLTTDKHTCSNLPKTHLLFTTRSQVRRISLDTPEHHVVTLPLNNISNAIALDVDVNNGMMYYSDVHLDVIRRANLDGSASEVIVSEGVMTVDGVAVDWVAGNLYWTDAGRNVIEVARLNGSFRKVLISSGLEEPRAIAVDPPRGLFFWSDWGSAPFVAKAYLDGSGRVSIVNKWLGWPNGLTIDYSAERIYWADAKLDKIETSDYFGDNRVVLVSHIPHPFGITLFNDHIYVTDWHHEAIKRFNKNTGRGKVVIHDRLPNLMDIVAVSSARQLGSNTCGRNNGGCSQLCLYRPHGHVCACPDNSIDVPCTGLPRNESKLNDLIAVHLLNSSKTEVKTSRSDLARVLTSLHHTSWLTVTLGVLLVILLCTLAIMIILVRRCRCRAKTKACWVRSNYRYKCASSVSSTDSEYCVQKKSASYYDFKRRYSADMPHNVYCAPGLLNTSTSSSTSTSILPTEECSGLSIHDTPLYVQQCNYMNEQLETAVKSNVYVPYPTGKPSAVRYGTLSTRCDPSTDPVRL